LTKKIVKIDPTDPEINSLKGISKKLKERELMQAKHIALSTSILSKLKTEFGVVIFICH